MKQTLEKKILNIANISNHNKVGSDLWPKLK